MRCYGRFVPKAAGGVYEEVIGVRKYGRKSVCG
jgi:hypothetical protein